MTDNEIIKALECCTNVGCSNCPLYIPENIGTCVKRIMFCAIELINRQKAEIEGLNNKIEEINNTENAKIFLQAVEHAKAEAIKAFVERLKENSTVDHLSLDGEELVCVEDIDNLVKEMTEEYNNGN